MLTNKLFQLSQLVNSKTEGQSTVQVISMQCHCKKSAGFLSRDYQATVLPQSQQQQEGDGPVMQEHQIHAKREKVNSNGPSTA